MSESKEDFLEGGSQEGQEEFKESKVESEGEGSVAFDPENVARVTFTPAKVKYVISHHKSSILSDEGPIVSLSSEAKDSVRRVFRSLPEEGEEGGGGGEAEEKRSTLPIERVAEVLIGAEVTVSDAKLVQNVVDDLLDRKLEGDEMDVEAVCKLADTFNNPAYEYGQRLRRYAGRGCADEVSKIIVRGCNPNTADGEGLTALHYAAEFNKLDVIATLRDVAGELLVVDAQCKYGWTPLHCASHHGNSDAVDMLIEMQANLEVPNKESKTALHLAAAQGRTELCEKLVAAGAQVNALDVHSMTPFHDAAYKGHALTFRALVRAGGDATLLDELGNTAESYLEDKTALEPADLEEDSTVLTSDPK
jgi:hypothetical protein